LTTYTDYALRVLIRLALRPDDLTTISEIAQAYGISEHHLMKVVHQLGTAGYIETVRGHGGGLRLAQKPPDIIVGHVVRLTEPDLGLVECFRTPGVCAIEPACVLSKALGEALSAFLHVLDGYTLADLIEKPAILAGLLKMPGAPTHSKRGPQSGRRPT
jgi:Rrf2 family nitric oxide-sensitive transcriptional repressor